MNVVPETKPTEATEQAKEPLIKLNTLKSNLSGEQMLDIIGKKVKKRVLKR